MPFRDEPGNVELVDELNDLIARHRAAIDVCDEAASRIGDLQQRVLVHELVSHHILELDALSRWVAELGARPSRAVRPFRQNRVEVQRLADDRDLVNAVLLEEELLGEAYRRVADHQDDRDRPAGALSRVAGRPRLHRAGLTRRLAALAAAR